jgi:lysozyme family protein
MILLIISSLVSIGRVCIQSALGVEDSNAQMEIITPLESEMSEQRDIMELVAEDNFDAIVGKTLAHEKGYKNFTPAYGGETNFGITKQRYPDLDIAGLTPNKAKEIYRADFYDAPGINKIAYPDVAYKVFDFGVTSGPEDSVRLLQRSLNKLGGKLKVDGMLGDKTLNELYKHRSDKVVKTFESGAINHYKSLGGPYVKAWIRRAKAR